MKKYNLSTLLKMCLILVSCLAFITACEKADELSTDQLGGGEILLRSFGPCPIARGGELRIIGTNLNKVEGVTIQGSGTITNITRTSNTEIRITVPQNAEPGVILLKAGNKEIKSITPLTFSEPISISAVTPLSVKAGGIIKIQGDYLNLIEEIIFTDDVHVLKADFKSQSRQEIELTVPIEAQTGKIIVSNGADIIPNSAGEVGIPIWVYSDDELIVALPIISKISPNPVKAGDLLTIDGTNFDLVDSIALGGNVGTRSFISKTATQIKVTVPANTQDGKIKAIAFSGVSVESADALELLLPTITSIDPNPVKNGTVLTIKGADLDLVNRVVFGGDKEGAIEPGGSATQMQVKVPLDAVGGVVTLHTRANKTVQSQALNFVVPVISDINPTTIVAGSYITITGTDFDLVTKVIFGGNTEGKIDNQTATSIEVQSLPNSLTGIVKLITSNGTEINSTQEITIISELPVITSLNNQVKPGALLTIEGTKLNLVESITFLNDVKATKYGTRSETLIEVYVPDNAKKGKVTLSMTTFDGKIVTSPEFTIAGTDPVVDPSLIIFDFEDRGGNNVANNSWHGVGQKSTEDGVSGAYYEITAAKPITGAWQWCITDNWCEINSNMAQVSGKSNYVLKMDVRLRYDKSPTGSWGCQLNFIFGSQSIAVDFAPYLKDGDVYSTGGEWKTISIPLANISSLPDPTPRGGDWGFFVNQGSPIIDWVGLCIDNIRYEKIN